MPFISDETKSTGFLKGWQQRPKQGAKNANTQRIKHLLSLCKKTTN